MTISELIQRLARHAPDLPAADVEASVNLILAAIAETLAANNRVEIRGFGVFGLNHRPPRIGRNPKTGDSVRIPAQLMPHFRPGKELRERVGQKHNNFYQE